MEQKRARSPLLDAAAGHLAKGPLCEGAPPLPPKRGSCKLRHVGVHQHVHPRRSATEWIPIYDDNLEDLAVHGASLVTLHLQNCCGVTTVAPVAGTLRRLVVSGRDCGVDDEGVEAATRLRVLDASENNRISTVLPFAATLRELDASQCMISDAGLKHATRLVVLRSDYNDGITTVQPFCTSLRSLSAAGECGIDDAALAHATRLEMLGVWYNASVTTVKPFGSTLRTLYASGNCGINDAGLAHATGIHTLCAMDNEGISTVQPFAKSLRSLVARGSCRIGDAGLRDATRI